MIENVREGYFSGQMSFLGSNFGLFRAAAIPREMFTKFFSI
jgi:hypothetical protein